MSSGDEQYYVRRRGQIRGPFDLRQLQRLLQRGQVSRVDNYSTDRRNWNKLESLEGLAPEPAVPEAETAPEPEDTSAEREWHYFHQGLQHGPVSEAELTGLIAQNVITEDTSIWCEGMGDWEPVHVYFPGAIKTPAAPDTSQDTDYGILPVYQPAKQPTKQPTAQSSAYDGSDSYSSPRDDDAIVAALQQSQSSSPPREDVSGLLTAGYLMLFCFTPASMIIGIILMTKGHVGHGLALLLLPFVIGALSLCLLMGLGAAAGA